MQSRRIAALLFVALGLAVAVLVALLETRSSAPPTIMGIQWDAKANETLLLLVCGLVFVGLCVAVVTRRIGRRGVVLLGLAAMVSGMLYLYGQRGVARRDYAKWHDAFHYVLGAKYFSELGYFELYNCVARAHIADNPRWAKRPWKLRDLRTYKMRDARQAAASATCEQRFSEDRWREFRRDVALFDRHKSIPSVLRDHGYNGSPTHTFFARALANAFTLDADAVTRLAIVDIIAIGAMMAAVSLAFGARIGFLFAVLFFVNFSDRFYFIGGSMMRYVWMASLTAGIAMLHRGRHASAAALMTTAALLNVFPVLFLTGIGVRLAWGWLRTRRVSHAHRRFVAAALVTAAIGLGLGASHSGGADNYGEFLGFIGGHSQKLTSSRTGLRYTVLHRDAPRRGARSVGYRQKGRELVRAAPFLVALGGLMVLVALILCARLDDVEATVLLGFTLFYVLFGTVEYYYATTPLLLLVFHRVWRSTRLGAAFVAALFGMMTIVLVIWRQSQSLKLCNNTIMSAGLLSMLAATLVMLASHTGLVSRLRGKTLAIALAAAAALGPVVTLVAFWIFAP